MAATTFPATYAVSQRSLGQSIALYAKEAKYEIVKYARIPIFALSTILFPVMFYVLFGIVMAPSGASRAEAATYLLATMACYGVMGVAMFSFGVGIAMERGQGWLQMKRASPMPVRRLNRLLLPAFGLPTSAMRGMSSGYVSMRPEASGKAATRAASRSPRPRPCRALTGYTLSIPRRYASRASTSPAGESALLAA